MKRTELIYVELKSGYSDNGPAWIGKGFYSKSQKTIYFNGRAFHRWQGNAGNHFDWETKEEYWISGVKKRYSNRHWAGGGTITIDEDEVSEFLLLRGLDSLPSKGYAVSRLINLPEVEKLNIEQNAVL